ncbi:four helix bundle protein [Sunxiuqinia sp. A32]|uniref:four helix bundle protein n=1 Tax=Sunxiuqinia sp. A32 TaxID=3461496 RepID=UPI0040464504
MDFRDLQAYKKAFALAMEIYKITKEFPNEEKYSLIDQIRRSSRSVCSNIAESYRKRNYPKHFVTKLIDSDGENSETLVWLEFALACNYIDKESFQNLESENKEIGELINYMILNPEKIGSSILI